MLSANQIAGFYKTYLKKEVSINIEVFYKVILSFWVCIAKLAQSTQNNKFAIFLQYLKDAVKDKLDFLPVDKHQRFFQIDTNSLGVCDQACPNYPK